MSTEENTSPMEKMLDRCAGDTVLIGESVAGALEFLTVRAIIDSPYYIFTDNDDAVTLVAAGPVVTEICEALKDFNIKRWEDEMDDFEAEVLPFVTNSDPGDEQDEPAPAS